MGYASEAETVLADNDWFEAPAANSTRRSEPRQHAGAESAAASSSSESFDEEELFSASGSLSSLHEFSDGNGDGALSGSESQSSAHSGPIVRIGATPMERGFTESELDVDGDFGEASRPGARPAHMRHARRGRKAISDDDDDGGGGADADDGDAADIEDAPSSSLRKHRQASTHSARRHAHAVTAADGDGTDAEPAAGAAAIQKPKTPKRRRPRYDDPDSVDENGRPQLVYFASKGDAVACRKLLLCGASIAAADTQGSTALHEAARHGHIEVLELLLKRPIRARPQQQQQQQQLRSSDGPDNSDNAREDMAVSRLARQLRSPTPNVNAAAHALRQTPLHLAVASNNIGAVRLLLDHGASTSIANARQLTPLDTCSNEDIARLLTDRAKTQRHISARDKAGQTKLHRACSTGDLEQTAALINQGADVNLKDNAGWTPLHEAALEGHNAVAVALLRCGADFAARGFGGDTPLHDACANGHVDVVRSLLIVGADLSLKNNKGVTPEDMAREEEQAEVLDIIAEYRQSSLHTPVRSAELGARPTGHSSDRGRHVADAAPPGPSAASEQVMATPESGSDRRRHKSAKAKAKAAKEKRSMASVAEQPRRADRLEASGTSKSYKRELVSLQRLRDEAEKPLVNYYFSSTSSKLSRDERKLQVLMGTIERMEKRKPKARRRSSAESLRGEADEEPADGVVTHGRGRSNTPERAAQKRPADVAGDRNDGDRDSSMDRSIRHRQRPATKRARYAADETVAAPAAAGGATKHAVLHSSLFGEVLPASEQTVEIKSEPATAAGHTVVHAPSPQRSPRHSEVGILGGGGGGGRVATQRKSSGSGRRERGPKGCANGGRTIVEDARASALTPSAIAAQAIRYLPLYTIQLHTDPPTSKLDYYVVDLQIRLLLGMSIDTPVGPPDSDVGDTNPLFEKYPQLCRQRITEAQKERLWEPLAGMFLSNMQIIHGSAAQSKRKAGSADGATAADSELVSKFTLHERAQFVALGLFFVKLDEVVGIIRSDYPQISKQLITITLDLSSVGIAGPVADAGACLPTRAWPRLAAEGAQADSSEGRKCPAWTGAHKTLPLRYALKLHYREQMEYLNDKDRGSGGA